jgi:predicted RNA binding protein YcfA (HicA-like mRNA interferase family)
VLSNSRDIIRRLERDGFVLKSTRGSHQKFWHAVTKRIVIVPHPRKDIPKGTVRSICDQAGWTRD